MVDGGYPSQIDEYRVIRLLGSGGMGEVYLVEHPRLPRRDALKLLDAAVSRNQQFRARFTREADLLARLRHPNIITVYDRGEFEGRLWLSMEYVDGQDASMVLRGPNPVPLDLAVRIIDGAGDALDYAYAEHRIMHRDVKPANILLEFGQGDSLKTVKLADFGIAKAAAESTSLTSTGVTIGTIAYISPEAIEGRALDNRADIYSLGCTAFELLTGEPPYTAGTIPALMRAHVDQPVPSITARNSTLPKRLDDVFARALAKDPAQRFSTCAEFVEVLRKAPGKTAPNTVTGPGKGAPSPTRAPTARATEQRASDPPPKVPPKRRPTQDVWGRPPTHPSWRRRAVLALIAAALVSVASVIVATHNGTSDTHSGKPAPSPSSSIAPVAPTTTSAAAEAPSPTTATTSVEPVQPYALPGCVRAPNLVGERPQIVNPTCNHSHWIEGLRWTSWGASGAEGTGIEQSTSCDPSCATGEIFRNPVHVRFTGSTSASSDSHCPTTFRYYTQMIVAYPDRTEIPFPVPTSDPTSDPTVLTAVVTRYNNMPAVRWYNLRIDCDSPNI
jgi:serine/threonine-protein kinase